MCNLRCLARFCSFLHLIYDSREPKIFTVGLPKFLSCFGALHLLHLMILLEVNQIWQWFFDVRSFYGACLSNVWGISMAGQTYCLQYINMCFLLLQKQKSCKVDMKKLGDLEDLSRDEGEPWSHRSLNQGFKCINLVSSENEEFDEQQASWKINHCERFMVLSPRKVVEVGSVEKESKCLGALATPILANECSVQDVEFPQLDCSGYTGGSTEGTTDSNSECEVDTERETLAMGILLLSEDSADSEAPLKQAPVSCEKKAETERNLLDTEMITASSEVPLKQTPVSCEKKAETEGNLMDTAVMAASSEAPLKETHDPPPDMEKMMQCERSQPRCSPQSEVTDQNFQSETPFCDLPIESVQEAQGTTSPSGWRQPTILSANDTGCRLSFLDAKSLVLPSFSDKKYCTIRVKSVPRF